MAKASMAEFKARFEFNFFRIIIGRNCKQSYLCVQLLHYTHTRVITRT
jgi:hypothetical protein